MAVDRATAPSPRAQPATPEVWLRKRRRTLVFAAYSFALAAFWIGMIFDVAADRATYAHNGGLAPFVLFFLALALPSTLLGVRCARSGLWVGAGGVIVRGPLRTWRMQLGDVQRFEAGVAGPGNGIPCPQLVRAHGRPVGVFALGSESFVFGYRRALDQMKPLCEQLNALLETLRAQAETPGA